MSLPLVTLDQIAANVKNAIVDGPFGSNLKRSDYVNYGIPVLQGKNITGNKFRFFDIRYITEQKAKELYRSSVREGDILMVKIGSIGYSAILDDLNGFDFAIIPANLAKITPDIKKIDPRYLLYILNSVEIVRTLKGLASKTAQPALSLKKIKSVKIPLPPLPEQRRIAAILDAADQLRQKDRALIDKYEELTQSLFLEMFGDPVRNPMGWEVKKMEDILEFLTSGSRGWAKYYSENGAIFLRIQNVGYDRLLLQDLTYVNAPISAESKRTTVKPGDIVLSITADLGRTGVIPNNFPKAHINQHLAILRLKKGYNPRYISAYIASRGGQSLFSNLDKGGVKAGLNFTDIRSYRVLCPPLKLQNMYQERVLAIEHQKSLVKNSIKKSKELFDSLLKKAFKGELTAKETSSTVP